MLKSPFKIWVCFGFLAGWALTAWSDVKPEERELYDFGQKVRKAGLSDQVEIKFSRLLAEYPNSEYRDEAAWILGQTRLEHGKWQEAMDLLIPLLSSVSDVWKDKYLLLIGEAQLKGQLSGEAYNTFERLVSEFRKSRLFQDAKYGMARAYLQQNRHEDAQMMLKDIMEKGSKELAARASLSLGISYQLQGKDFEASQQLGKIVKEEKGKPIGYQALYALGELEFLRNRMEAAKQRYGAIVKPDPLDDQVGAAMAMIPSALFRLGQIEVRAGKSADAIPFFEGAFNKGIDQSLRLQSVDELSDAYLAIKEPEKLAKKILDWAELQPKGVFGESLLYRAGVLWRKAGKPDAALDVFKKLSEAYPNGKLTDQVHYQMGGAWQELKKPEGAAAEFQKALDSAKSPSLKMDALLKLGDLSFEETKFKVAATFYKRAYEVKDVSPAKTEFALHQTALAYLQAKEYEDVVQCQKLHQNQFSDPRLQVEFVMLAAEAHRRQKHLTQVTDIYKELLDQPKVADSPLLPQVWVDYIETFYLNGKFKEAIEAANSFLAKHQKNELAGRVSLVAGHSYERLEQVKQAVEVFERLAGEQPKSPAGIEARFWLGAYFDRLRQYDKSLENFEKLIQSAPNHPLVPEAMYYAGRAVHKLSLENKGTDWLKKLVEQYPQSPRAFDAKFFYADILSKDGKYKDACDLFKDLTSKIDMTKPETVSERALEAIGRQAQCERQLNHYEEALKLFMYIRDFKKADPSHRNEAWVEIGETYECMKKYPEAIGSYLTPLLSRDPKGAPPSEREFYWVCKGGFEAVQIYQMQKKWQEATKVLNLMVDSNLPCKKEAELRLKQIKTEQGVAQ